jgi:hypothetical protein
VYSGFKDQSAAPEVAGFRTAGAIMQFASNHNIAKHQKQLPNLQRLRRFSRAEPEAEMRDKKIL